MPAFLRLLRSPAGLARLGILLGLVSAVGFTAGVAVGAARRTAGQGQALMPPDGILPVHLADALWELRGRGLAFPVRGGRAELLLDSFEQPRGGGRRHQAVDIPAPRGTPVHAVDDGVLLRLSRNAAAGLSVYQRDRDGRYGYFYAHLHGYAPGLAEGQRVVRGDVIGYVGSTGNARGKGPHLHFAIRRLDGTGAEWSGDPLNPYHVLRVPSS